MSEKLHQYEGRLYEFKNIIREKYSAWKENQPSGFLNWIKDKTINTNCSTESSEDYSHIYRRKSTRELIRISAAVMGIEFSYAAETAFVSPTLLKIGVEHEHMTLIWALSPLIGFFLTPVLGCLSDRCHLKFGRRRPFILMMSLGVLFGLILVPNGEYLGYVLGDKKSSNIVVDANMNYTSKYDERNANTEELYIHNYTLRNISSKEDTLFRTSSHYWGVIITVIGTVLLDFNADACQSPSRAYLLDITTPDDHVRGLSTFTIMAGLGGCFGYALGGINWDVTTIGNILGGHVRAVFTLITILFIACVTYTITSFKEIPLYVMELRTETIDTSIIEKCKNESTNVHEYGSIEKPDDAESTSNFKMYSKLDESTHSLSENNQSCKQQNTAQDINTSMALYLKSIIYMPPSIKKLCITNLFCWMAHVSYSLYFTDFVGEAVFEGNPMAVEGNSLRELYEDGVRFGCWGMSMYSLSCACYSMKIEALINKFGTKNVYVGGLLTYAMGMLLMAITRNKFGVIIFSWTAGIMYSTLFTIPYLIVAYYHAKGTFDVSEDGAAITINRIRGLGTDVAIISSMVFLAQFLLSICMGSIVHASGTTTAIVIVASVLAALGAVSASQIIYLDL